jgi:phage terminase large subunit
VKPLERIRSDPVWFLREVLAFEPWSKQREILEAVRDHDRVAVRSANAVGKTSIAGRAVLWWLAGGPGSIALTTAPTDRQVRRLLWKEIRQGYHASRGFFDGELFDTRLSLGDGWEALGLSTDDAESFSGWHDERVLVVVDEASGVGEDIFEAIEGVLAGGHAKLLLISNPTRTSGQFFEAFHRERRLWRTIAVSALDTPAFTGESVSEAVARRLVTRGWVEEKRAKWGEQSPLFQVRVLGEFPSQSEDAVCAIAEVEAAQRRRLVPGFPTVVACDVARFGSDETVIATRRGPRVRVARSYVGRDLMQTAGEILQVARRLRVEANEAPVVVVDDAGLGGGVVDRLREVGEFRVVAFNGAGAARERREYPNRRSEAWFVFAGQLADIDLDGDEQLAADLVAPSYRLDSQGRRVVEAKSETKRRLGRSPDRADAVLMAFATDTGPPAEAEFYGESSLDAVLDREAAHDRIVALYKSRTL